MNLKKNFSLIATIAVIVILSVGGYYLINLKQGLYPATDFVSIDYKWGVGDSLVNHYNSSTGSYQYLDNKDSLVHKKFKLHANEVIYLHSKANELDFWKLPNVIANPNADLKSKKVLRYEFIVTYQHQTKKVIYLTDYDENQAVAEAAEQLQKVVSQMVNETEERYTRP